LRRKKKSFSNLTLPQPSRQEKLLQRMAMSKAPQGTLAAYYEPLLDSGMLPDFVLRQGIRHLLGRRKRQCDLQNISLNNRMKVDYIQGLKKKATIAIETKAANEQQYVLYNFFSLIHCVGGCC
jgi:hypothetical protein